MPASSSYLAFSNTVYPELKRIAARHIYRERHNHTLCPTALVNEAYIKLQSHKNLSAIGRSHFMALSSRCIRQILVDYARGRGAQKRGSNQPMFTLKEELVSDNETVHDVDLILLDTLLQRLKEKDRVQEQVVELRFFAGMKNAEIAESLDISIATVKRKWIMARTWLFREMNH
jgi:RNA polymerase sigma factor (TIGR02999 family)